MVDVASEIAPPSCVAVLPVKVLLVIVKPVEMSGIGGNVLGAINWLP